MDPFVLAAGIETGLKIAVRIIQVFKNNDGGVTLIEYCRGTSDINAKVIADSRDFIASLKNS